MFFPRSDLEKAHFGEREYFIYEELSISVVNLFGDDGCEFMFILL